MVRRKKGYLGMGFEVSGDRGKWIPTSMISPERPQTSNAMRRSLGYPGQGSPKVLCTGAMWLIVR